LRQINAVYADYGHIACMIRFARYQSAPAAPPPQSDTASNMAAMTGRLGLSTNLATVAAAWPVAVSHLALALVACQRCDSSDMCGDWLARAPMAIQFPPAFCPNAPAFTRAKKAVGF
jgi:hypothetical protein